MAQDLTGCIVTDHHRHRPLIPLPAQRQLAAAAPLPAGVALEVRLAGRRTPRLDRALARFRSADAAATAPRVGAAAPLVVNCAAAAAAYPALDDDESYTLAVSAGGVRLSAPCEWGVLRGLATLLQLRADGAAVAAQLIRDRPRFPWRGLMLDVARHFLPLPALLRTLDAMAVFKLNVLHLHLSDDQGFRYPSRCFPELRSADHYTADELATLVRRAADRGIRVVPELDVPGHTASWLQARPDWGNRPGRASRRFGVHRECLDPTRPTVRAAVAALFAELAESFPDRYLHFGGDEVHPEWWTEDPAVAAFIAAHGLSDSAGLQAYFNRHVAAVLTELERIPLGWDEVLHPDLPGEVVVQAWRGVGARERALAAGHDCVLSAPYYLDLCYPADVHYAFDPGASATELLAQEDALLADPRFEHVAGGLAWTRQWRALGPVGDRRTRPGRLLGAEACLWSELVDARLLDVRLWSRMPALAQRFWSPADGDGADDLPHRLAAALRRLPRWAGVDVAGDVRELVEAAGVQPGWLPLVEALEPVKWYGRLLGEAALAARLRGREMPQSRPYDADTPLDRVVDALPPESPVGRELVTLTRAELTGDVAARQRLRALAGLWQGLPAAAGPVELAEPAATLRSLGDTVAALLDGRLAAEQARAVFASALRPHGEYLLAPAPLLLAWLDARAAGASDD